MRKIAFLFLAFVLFCSCGNEERNTLKEKSEPQSSLILSYKQVDSLRQTGVIDVNLYDSFIVKALEFYKTHPEDPIVPEMLNNAGIASMVLGKYYKDYYPNDVALKVKYAKEAIKIFDTIIKVYPDYEGVRISYYNKGVVYDDILEDYASAEVEYREFIHKFPHDSTAISVATYLKYLGLTPEEMLASFGIDQPEAN